MGALATQLAALSAEVEALESKGATLAADLVSVNLVLDTRDAEIVTLKARIAELEGVVVTPPPPPPPPPPTSDRAFKLPAAGATLSGVVPSGGVEIVGSNITHSVCLIDGVVASGTQTSAPFQFWLDTTKVPNGPHKLQADITGTDGKVERIEIDITVQNDATVPVPPPPPPTTGGPGLAMYRGPAPGGVTLLNEAIAWLGKEIPTGVMFGSYDNTSWANVEGPDWLLGPWSNWMKAKPGRNMHFRLPTSPQGVTLASVASGVHDSHFKTLAGRLMQHGFTAIEIAIGWEFDLPGTATPWRAGPASGKEDEFAAAFRRIVQTMRPILPNVKFCWNPTEDCGTNKAYLESAWPGNESVDTVGVDCYDFSWWGIDGVSTYYPSPCDAACRLSRQKKVWPHRLARFMGFVDFARSKGKPMSFPEWGCSTWKLAKNVGHGGGDNPYYIERMHEFFMNPANKVWSQAYFNRENSALYHVIGPGSNFPQASVKYKQLFGA